MFVCRYSEIKDYDFVKEKSKNGEEVGHFTQLVWRNIERFGVGIATMPYRRNPNSLETFIVAKYAPRGNLFYSGRRLEFFTKNVQPRKKGGRAIHIYL